MVPGVERQPLKKLKPEEDQLLKEKLIKIGAKAVSHCRYVAVQMAEVAIPRILFADILRLVSELRPPPAVASTCA
jgi:hypothetical protein